MFYGRIVTIMQPQPYQPQQSPMQPMQPSPKPKKKITITGVIFVAMIVTGVVLLIALIAWLGLSFKASSDTGKTLAGAAAVLEPKDSAPSNETIDSSLGVKVPFNARELSGFGLAEDVTYSSEELREKRPYSEIRLRPDETSQATRNEITMVSPELRITTSVDKQYWSQFEGKKGYKDLSKLDILVQETTSQRTKDKWVSAGDVEAKRLGDVDYRKVVYTSKNEDHGVTSLRREDCYVTVQHDRPFVACVNNVRSGNFAALPQLENIINQLSYYEPSQDALISDEKGKEADKAMLDGKKDQEVEAGDGKEKESPKDDQKPNLEKSEPKQPAKISPYLSESSDFLSFAKAAPATVRVGSIYCADVKLTLPSGKEGPLLTGACVDKSGTGFFVSRDGFIATSASVTSVKPEEAIRAYIMNAPNSSQVYERLDRVLGYMVEGRLIMQTDADAIVAGVQERNQDVVEKVSALSSKIAPENITISQESYSYAVQLQDKPIVVNEKGNGSLEFALSDAVVAAGLEGSRYSADKTQDQVFNGDTIKDDIALLKIKGNDSYPALMLASDTNVSEGAPVNVIGMPMYAIGSLSSGQLRPTPLFRQGAAGEVFTGSNAQRLLSINTSSFPGFAGAPALNKSAQVVGIATYNNLSCPSGKCFAGTILRDTAEISNLVRSRNVTLRPSSVISDTWNKALEELIRGNYKKAYGLFNDSHRLYPKNYLATPFANYAKSQFGTVTDTSAFNTGIIVSQLAAIISVFILILLVIARVVVKVVVRPQYKTQYGATAGGQYIDANQWRPSPPSASGSIGPTPPPNVPFTQQQPAVWQPPQQTAASSAQQSVQPAAGQSASQATHNQPPAGVANQSQPQSPPFSQDTPSETTPPNPTNWQQ